MIMGAGQSDLYKGTYGDDPNHIPDMLKGKNKFPPNDSQIKHIFRNSPGHLPDTPENRELLVKLANDIEAYQGKDKYGNDWHVRLNEDGTQDWARCQNQKINDGGKNIEPLPWNEKTGLFRNIWEDEE